jgi:hypothetical protein
MAALLATGRRQGREERQGEKEERRGLSRGVQGLLQGILLGLQAASRRWHSGDPAQDTQVRCLLEEEERNFCREPPRVWRIPGKKIKTAHFVRFGDSNGVQKL